MDEYRIVELDEYRIVELVKEWYRKGQVESPINFLLNNNTIISYHDSYEPIYGQNPSISKQVIGYVYENDALYLCIFRFPVFIAGSNFPLLYLYKIGYVYQSKWYGSAPLPNLKYSIMANEYSGRFAIEIVDLDMVANNLNLPKIVVSVLGPKLLRKNVGERDKIEEVNVVTYEERDKIEEQMFTQKLFAGYTWYDAYHVLYDYFDNDERELSKEVLKISRDYERVFRPYRAVYDMKTWELVVI